MVDLCLVISMPDRPAGRGKKLKSPPVIDYCRQHKIPFWQTENINRDEDLQKKLTDSGVDTFMVLAFAQFFTKKFISLPRKGAFNIHTSLLPKYRGAAPIQYAILNGDEQTGVSIQTIVPKMDAGELVYHQTVDISPQETGGRLYTRLKFRAALALNDFLYRLANDDLTYTSQDESQASYAPSLKKEDGWIDFEKDFPTTILNQIRALQPWPGAFCYFNQKRLKVFSATRSELSLMPGEVSLTENGPVVGTPTKSLLLNDIQLEGKKRLDGKTFASGYLSKNDHGDFFALDPRPEKKDK